MPLELGSLRRAVDALERSAAVSRAGGAAMGADLRETVRAGVIQNFEVAYEQCWKFMQRWVRANRTPEDADFPRTRKELFRLAARCGLIPDPLPWFESGDARNRTAHIYDAAQAASVYEAAERFVPYARELLHSLEERND